MTRDEYEAGIAHARDAATETLNHGGKETPDEVWNGAHATLDALLLLEGSIKLGACPWTDYEPFEEEEQ